MNTKKHTTGFGSNSKKGKKKNFTERTKKKGGRFNLLWTFAEEAIIIKLAGAQGRKKKEGRKGGERVSSGGSYNLIFEKNRN